MPYTSIKLTHTSPLAKALSPAKWSAIMERASKNKPVESLSRIYYSRVQSSNYLTSSIRKGLLIIAPLEFIHDYDNSDT